MADRIRTETLGSILSALEFAAHKHRDQRRKDVEASPYINHPIALANVLVNEAGITDVDTICAALLHDTVEDTDTTPEELESLFGARISAIVAEVTDNKSLDKRERKRQQVAHAARLSTEAKRVKFADKTCNLRDIAARPPRGLEPGAQANVLRLGQASDRSNARLATALGAYF